MKEWSLLLVTFLMTLNGLYGFSCALVSERNENDSIFINKPDPEESKRSKELAGMTLRTFPEMEVGRNISDFYSLEDRSMIEFTPEYLSQVLGIDKTADSIIAIAGNVFNEIQKHQRFIDVLSGKKILDLPVGIRKKVSPTSHLSIGVVKASFHSLYAEVDLFARLELNELNAVLYFAAANVKISRKGGIYEEAKLHLVKDFPVIQQGGQWLLTFRGDYRRNGSPNDESFITIDCEGNLVDLSLSADVRISKNIAVPLKTNGDYAFPDQLEPNSGSNPVNNKSYLGAGFKIHANQTGDFIFSLSLPLFELRSLKGWGFKFKDCTLDLSDVQNFSGMKFPKAYTENGFLIRGQRELWRGFYAREVEVMLPPEFKLTASEERISIGAYDLIIDEHGVTGEFFAENIIPLNKGNAGGWQFSVSELKAAVVANVFTGAGFAGEIRLPVTEQGQGGGMDYEGFISPYNEYLLEVAVDKELDFDLFKAKARIFKGSYIRLEVSDQTFYPEANLTGIMQFGNQNRGIPDSVDTKSVSDHGINRLELNGLLFQNLRIASKEPPFLEADYLAFTDSISSPKYMGFELGVHQITLNTAQEGQAVLNFNAFLNLDKEGIKGDVAMRIEASMQKGDLTQWKFQRFHVGSVGIDIRKSNFELTGNLHFVESHETYGDALAGHLQLLSQSLKLEIGAKAIFGKKDGFHYWFADAFGMPSSTGSNTLKIYNLSGGLYHHMKKVGYDRNSGNPSGILYEPDINTNIGFKAMVAFEVKKKVMFTGLAGLEMSFNSSEAGGGVRRIGFYGAASLLNPVNTLEGGSNTLGDLREVQELQSEKETALSATNDLSLDRMGIRYFASEVFPDILSGKEVFAAQVAIDYDLSNDIYWGMFDTYLNLGGIKGDGEKNRLGYLEFYSGPEDWYVYVGTPEKRFGVRDIPVGPFMARANLYYMAGTLLPAPAPPPAHIAELLNAQDLGTSFNHAYSDQPFNDQGYAFGASLALGVGFDWGLVYANVEAGVGFDLMMKNFGDVGCTGNSGQLGMNGWYASGQSYAYLQGAIGVRVDLFLMKMDIPVIRGGLALLAQAQLPNPWFIKGYAGLEFHVLGHIHIKTRLKVVLGEPCDFMNKQGLEELDLIADMSPHDGADNVDIFESVGVALNMPEGEMIRVETVSGKRYFKAVLDTLVVYQDNKKLPGQITRNDQGDLFTWSSPEVLPEKSNLMAWVKLSFLEYKNGTWETLTQDGLPVTEERKISFTTGEAPQSIPYSNISSMYPVVSHNFMFPKEFEKGYVKLKKGQDYLFDDGLITKAVISPKGEGKAEFCVFTYDKTNNIIRYTLPPLGNGRDYIFQLISFLPAMQQAGNNSVYKNIDEDLSVSGNSINRTGNSNAVFKRLEFDFSTSRYDTFKEKIKAMNVVNHSLFIDGDDDVAGFSIQTAQSERWDIHDLTGARYNEGKAFIRPLAYMTDDYYELEVEPLLYHNYPPDKGIRFLRDTTIYGLVPQKAIEPSLIYISLIRSDPGHPYLESQFPFHWRMARVYKRDFRDLQQQLVERYLNTDRIDLAAYEKYKYLINGVFPYVNTEKYKVYLHYILPTRTTGNKIRVDYQNTF
ncbi:hypothetical protein E7Z59_10620 [Robertkochia marina]|uniref:Uncharacterized protein n=1 Tax=Robertkochia marina TaxID=1227945 RepID=A0A4S3LXJ9_9FLAO|nr:hypothetical protein [Robertkochia marina]THD66262.1 hypothetical protein E7Z59_10620 [Robertkochia marina]TRZ40900.1 hypothetical protein D3A96_14670 [Robertkochia marina]